MGTWPSRNFNEDMFGTGNRSEASSTHFIDDIQSVAYLCGQLNHKVLNTEGMESWQLVL